MWCGGCDGLGRWSSSAEDALYPVRAVPTRGTAIPWQPPGGVGFRAGGGLGQSRPASGQTGSWIVVPLCSRLGSELLALPLRGSLSASAVGLGLAVGLLVFRALVGGAMHAEILRHCAPLGLNHPKAAW